MSPRLVVEPPGQYVPIIAPTAEVLKGERERCIEAGMDDYLAKPFHLETIGAMLARHLATAALARGQPEPGHGAGYSGSAVLRCAP